MEMAWKVIEKHLDRNCRMPITAVTRKHTRRTTTLDDYEAGYEAETAIINTRLHRNAQYEALWEEIVAAASSSGLIRGLRGEDNPSNKISSHSHMTGVAHYKDFTQIKQAAEHLAGLMTDSQLDLRIFEFFSDVAAKKLFEQREWKTLKPYQRRTAAASVLPLAYWQSAPEFLSIIAEQAEQLANHEREKKWITCRNTADRVYNHFVRHMGLYVRHTFDRPMYGVLARMASVLFSIEFEKDASKERVKQALRHAKSKGGA
jgi:hypothetical protein